MLGFIRDVDPSPTKILRDLRESTSHLLQEMPKHPECGRYYTDFTRVWGLKRTDSETIICLDSNGRPRR